MDITDLKQDPQNARKRGDRAKLQIQDSLREFGAARSIVVDKDGIVRAGNGTVEAAKEAGITKVRIVDSSPDELIAVRRADLSGKQAQAYAIADNRTAELASDCDTFKGKLEELAR